MYIPDNKDLYASLKSNREEIENKFGCLLDWQDLPMAKAARIAFEKNDVDIKQKDNIESAYKWLLEHSEKLYNAVKKHI